MSVKTKKTRLGAYRWHMSDGLKLLLAVIFVVAVLLPLGVMLSQMDSKSVHAVVSAPNFGHIVLNSLTVSLTATVITVLLAYALALATQRCDIKCKGLFALIFTLPMLVPSISNGMGLLILLGQNGVITRLTGWGQSIYGFWGIVVGSLLYAFPVAYLMFADILRYEDMTPYEAARVLGLSKWRQFTAITLPYLRKPLVSVVFSVFTLIVTDYGVPLMVGGTFKTIPVVMYEDAVGGMKFGQGAVYGMILLAPAVIAFLLDFFNKDKGNSVFVVKNSPPKSSLLAKAAAYTGGIVTSALMLLPGAAFILLAFTKTQDGQSVFTLENLKNVFVLHSAESHLLNSVIMALGVACLGVTISFVTAYFTARMRSGASRFLHLASITTGAIPGMVLGLSYVMTFKQTALYGTLVILIMVNMVHFLSSPYLMMYNSLSKINENLEPVGETLGISRIRMIKDVFIPQCIGTLAEMFSYFFVNCMMTISAVSFLATTDNKPLSLLITQFQDDSRFEFMAVVSLMILVTNLLIKGVARLCKKLAHSH